MTLTLTVIGTARSLPAQLAALRCRKCDGKGHYHMEKDFGDGRIVEWSRKCPACGGTGVEG